MVLDVALPKIQHYKVSTKGKVEQFSEGVAPFFDVVAIEKGAFESTSTKVTNFTYLYRLLPCNQILSFFFYSFYFFSSYSYYLLRAFSVAIIVNKLDCGLEVS